VKQQAQRAEEQQQHARQQQSLIEQLRAPPAHSPQSSAHASPQRSPQQESRSIAVTAAAAAAALPEQAAPQSRFARKEPRAQDLREYDGAAGEKLDAWLDELSLACMLFELNDREARSFAVSRLRGAALQWWLALDSSAQAAIGDRKALAAALRARFQPVTTARTARQQLDKLTQGSRPVNDYIADFQRLRTQLPHLGEQEALFAFEKGLDGKLVEKLHEQGISTVQTAIAMAARVGGLAQAAAASKSSLRQMDIDDGDGSAGRLDRIEAALNAMAARDTSGMGAKTQTHQGYTQQREAQRGGRGGFRGRGGFKRGPPEVRGVPEHVVRKRMDNDACIRCGEQGHRSPSCPNTITASGN